MGSNVSRTDSDIRGTQEPIAIYEIDCMPIGEAKMEPNPGIEKQEEKRQ